MTYTCKLYTCIYKGPTLIYSPIRWFVCASCTEANSITSFSIFKIYIILKIYNTYMNF